MDIAHQHTPSDDLFKAVRACLVLRGLSFAGYCRDRKLTRQNAAAALRGLWRGRKASALVDNILADLGMME